MNKIAILIFSMLMFAQAGCAASFDCDKASTEVERLVCGTPDISKLDENLSKLYQDTLGKANAEQKQRLIAEQRHWLKHTRNICKDEVCLKLAYWSRQAGLETFYEPKSPIYEHETDKTGAIKQVLATVPLYLAEGTQDVPFCTQLLSDLKQMKGITFVDPVAQSQSYEDPALDEWKQHCGSDSPPLHFSSSCLPNVISTIRGYQDTLGTPGCYKGFGIGPFKIFTLPAEEPGGKPRTILYSDDNFGSNVWEYDNIYTEKLWNLKKPQLGRGGFAGFRQMDMDRCESVRNSLAVDAANGDRNGENFNSVIKYNNQYFTFVLHNMNSALWRMRLDTVTPRGAKSQKSCRWIPIAPKKNQTNQGE